MTRREFSRLALAAAVGAAAWLLTEPPGPKLLPCWRLDDAGRMTRVRMHALRKGDRFIFDDEGAIYLAVGDGHTLENGVGAVTALPET